MAYIVDEKGNSKPLVATDVKKVREGFTIKRRSGCNVFYILFLLLIIAACIYAICKLSCSPK